MKDYNKEVLNKISNIFSAFSLAESIIIVTTLTVAIAASTPFITKKLANIAQFGGIGGGNKGRYEFFQQELIQFGDVCKTKNDNKGCKKIQENITDTKRYITIYQKLTDAEYHATKGEDPQEFEITEPNSGNKRHYKSTIYTVIDEKAELVSKDDSMSIAKSQGKTYEKSSKYIFEPSNITYDGLKEEAKRVDGIDKERRVIEGNLTTYYKNECIPDIKQKCFIIDNSKKEYFNGDVNVVPWKRTIKGKQRVVEDRPIKDEELIEGKVRVTLPEDAKTFTIHAVGGGGAGGSFDDSDTNYFLQRPIIPNNSSDVNPEFGTSNTDTQRKILKHYLYEAFREYVKIRYDSIKTSSNEGQKLQKKYFEENLTDTNGDLKSTLTESDIVVFNDDTSVSSINTQKSFNIKNADNNHYAKKYFSKNDKPWIVVNTKDGTITVKVDIRFGMIYPHQLLKYTEKIGISKESTKLYYMPRWFTAKMINEKFKLAARVCSGGGYRGGNFTAKSTDDCDFIWGEGGCESHDSGYHTAGRCCTWWAPCPEYSDPGCTLCRQQADIMVSECDCACSGYYSNTNTAEGAPTCGGKGECSADCGHSSSSRSSTTYNTDHKGGKACNGVCHWISVDIDETKFPSILAGCGESDRLYANPNQQNYEDYNANSVFGGDITPKTFVDPRYNNPPSIANIHGANGMMGESCSVKTTLGDLISTLYVRGGENGYACPADGYGSTYDNGVINVSCSYQQAHRRGGTSKGEQNCDNCSHNGNGEIKNKTNQVITTAEKPGGFYSSVWNNDDFNIYGKGILTTSTGYYNHIYLWTIPYALDYLAYGEAGQPGDHVSKTISDLTETLYITLGQGGEWKKDDKFFGKEGGDIVKSPNGTPTIVEYGNETSKQKLLQANGGKGGENSKKTNSFNMCFNATNPIISQAKDKNATPSYYCSASPDPDESGNIKDGVYCCTGSKANYSTKDIASTSIKISEFDKQASSMNNSDLVGLGLGRSGEGIGSGTFNDEMIGTRYGVNASTDTTYTNADKIIVKDISKYTVTPPAKVYYRNEILKPANTNAIGGGGAVVIMW